VVFNHSITILLKQLLKYNIDTMLMKVFGVLSMLVGFFLLFGAPVRTAVQPKAFGNTARLLGLILIAVGIILLKF